MFRQICENPMSQLAVQQTSIQKDNLSTFITFDCGKRMFNFANLYCVCQQQILSFKAHCVLFLLIQIAKFFRGKVGKHFSVVHMS